MIISQVDPIQRHKRILSIVSHLGLNKRKRNSSMILERRSSQSRTLFFPQSQQSQQSNQNCDNDLIVMARSRLKPLKQKSQLKSESKLVEEVISKFEGLKEDDLEENNAYQHIQKSLIKIQEEQIIGRTVEVRSPKFLSTFNSTPLIETSPKAIRVQNMFEKQCSVHKLPKAESQNLQSVRRKLGNILYQSKQSFMDFQAERTNYEQLTRHNKLYQQRTATYFQY